MCHLIKYFCLLYAVLLTVTAAAGDEVLYQFGGWYIKDGKSGPIAMFQDRMNTALDSCNSELRLNPDGIFGRETQSAISEITKCAAVSVQLSDDSPARTGALTTELWHIIVPDTPVPSVSRRAASLKLTFENTDYDQMEWNYCQSRPRYNPEGGQSICFSNDQRSFITWGPNGATAGHGREVQAILKEFLSKTDTGNDVIFDQAFGDEANAVRRMMTLGNATDNSALETYLCGVWINSERRIAWKDGFKSLGKAPIVQEVYREIYKSQSFDGGKIKHFYDVWQSTEFSLPVTEIDHAYFIDRSAHMSISKPKLIVAMQELHQSAGADWPLSSAKIRQYISLNVIPSNQRQDRMGRDIAFYVEGVGEAALSDVERKAWMRRGSSNVIDVGLSDDRLMPAFKPCALVDHPMPSGKITDDEAALCPEAVLNPALPK